LLRARTASELKKTSAQEGLFFPTADVTNDWEKRLDTWYNQIRPQELRHRKNLLERKRRGKRTARRSILTTGKKSLEKGNRDTQKMGLLENRN